jgi:hypothetical protein
MKEYLLRLVGKHGRRDDFPVGRTNLDGVVQTTKDHFSLERNKTNFDSALAVGRVQQAAVEAGATRDEVEEAFQIGETLGLETRANFVRPNREKSEIISRDIT